MALLPMTLLLRFVIFITLVKVQTLCALISPTRTTSELDAESGKVLVERGHFCWFNNSEFNQFVDQIASGKQIAEPEHLPFMAMVYGRFRMQKCFNGFETNEINSAIQKKKRMCIESIEHYPMGTAAIINGQFLVTTAHQFGNSYAPTYIVGSGSDDLQQQNITQVARIVSHPKYDGTNSLYDIALVQVVGELPDVLPMCMYMDMEEQYPNSTKLQMKMAGWSVGLNRYMSQLVRENVRSGTLSKCCKAHRINPTVCSGASPMRTYDNYTCAKATKPRKCNGKFGQVLYQSIPRGNTVLRGFSVNTGYNCKRNSPLMFVDIRFHTEWIVTKMMEMLSEQTSPYVGTIHDSEIILPNVVPHNN